MLCTLLNNYLCAFHRETLWGSRGSLPWERAEPPAGWLRAAPPPPDLLPFVSNYLPILECSHSLQPTHLLQGAHHGEVRSACLDFSAAENWPRLFSDWLAISPTSSFTFNCTMQASLSCSQTNCLGVFSNWPNSVLERPSFVLSTTQLKEKSIQCCCFISIFHFFLSRTNMQHAL